jgi:predicted N-acyltransferase
MLPFHDKIWKGLKKMYSIQVKNSLDEVYSDFWLLNQKTYSALYRTPMYMRDSQTRLGEISLYVEVFLKEKPVALFPIVIFQKRSDYPPIDPHEIVRKALQVDVEDKPVAMSATLFGPGCPVLVKEQLDWDTVLTIIKEELRSRFDCKYLTICYQSQYDDPFLEYSFKSINIVKHPHKEFGLLHLREVGSFEEYLNRLSKNARNSFRREARIAEKNGISVRTEPIERHDTALLGKMAAQVYKKYGHDVDYNRLKTFAENSAASFPGKTGVFTAWKEDVLLSFAMYIEYDNVIHMKMPGRNYDLDVYQTYFLVAYHEPIRYAIHRGISCIDYGGGATEVKKRRGLELQMWYSYVL